MGSLRKWASKLLLKGMCLAEETISNRSQTVPLVTWKAEFAWNFLMLTYNKRLSCSQLGRNWRDHFVNGKIRTGILCWALLSLAAGQAFAMHRYVPQHHRRVHRHHFRRAYWNPVFRPSRESLLIQNEEIDRLDLPRIQDEAQLQELVASGDLVPITASESLRIAPQLPENRRYCRPWTLDFLNDLSNDYYKEFGSQIQVNSAVRTVKVQKKLRRHNRNAAPYEGDTASSHLAGITVDVQRRGMTIQQIKWVEQYLVPLHDMGLIEPEEERHQWCFHIMVSDRYDDWRESRMLAGDQQGDEGPVNPELQTVSQQQ